MTGSELYSLYAQAHREQNCTVPPWISTPQIDRDMWNRMAELIEQCRTDS